MTKAFTELGLSEAALRAVQKMGFTEPTPVQEQTIPLVLEGRDVCAAASTGTGKTAAFLLPTMSTLPRAKRGEGPRMLVVSPTRELASQIGDACFPIARETGHFIATVFGGTAYGPQIKKLKRGVDILIATPGRLLDLRKRGVVKLDSVDVLVLDEADRMLDMGFLPDMEQIISATPDTRQTLLFSATIDRKIMNSVGGMLRDPQLVEIAHRGETAATVDQYIMPITQGKKSELLQAVLSEKGSQRIIVFARTKNRTETCMEQLREAGYRAESIHSDKSQFKRKRALENFSRGKTDILVATDVLARGIDVTGVDHVINYDMPDMPEDYVHRIGRTGRAGEEGYAISFVSPDTRRLLRDVEHLIGREIPLMELENYELDANLLAKGKGGNGGRGNKGGYGGKRGGYQGSRSNGHSGGKQPYRGAGKGGSHESRAPHSEGGSSFDKRQGKGEGRSFDKRQNGERTSGHAATRPGNGSRYRSQDERPERFERDGGKGGQAQRSGKPQGSRKGYSKGYSKGYNDREQFGKRSNKAHDHRGQSGKAGASKKKARKEVPERYKMFAK